MTAQKFSDNKNKRRSYFAFMLRQNWPVLVTNTIILVLFNILFLSLSIADTWSYSFVSERAFLSILEEWRAVNVVVVSCLSVLWGCTTMPYLNNKVGIHFYHSLPLTRGSQYFREIAVKGLWMVVPLAVSCVLGCLTTCAMTGFFSKAVILMFCEIFLYATIYFFLFYSIMIFSTTFTGTVFTRLLVAGVIVFMPMVSLYCFSFIFGFSTQYSSLAWMQELARALFGPIRAVMLTIGEADSVFAELLVTVACTLAFFALGALIYKRRKSELSGTPILSKAASAIIKYSVLFACATVFSMFMRDFADGVIGIFIGATIGALLALMLMNTILQKTAKKMFSGMRGFAVFCASFFAVFILFGFDFVGLDTYVPPASMITSVDVAVGGSVYNIDEDEDIARIVEITKARFENGSKERNDLDLAKHGISVEGATVEISSQVAENEIEYMFESVMYDRFSVRITFRTFGGFRFEKSYYDGADAHYELLKIVADSDGFADTYFELYTPIVKGASVEYVHWSTSGINAHTAQKMYDSMRDSYNGIEYFNRPLLATVYFQGANYMPYFEEQEEAIDVYLHNVSSVIVVNTETGETKEYTEKADLEKIFSAAVVQTGYPAAFTPKDDTYAFVAVYGDLSEYEYFTGRFLKDRVPTLS